MELKHYVRLLRSRWPIVVLSVLAFTQAAALLAWDQRPTYAARTQLFVATNRAADDPSQTYQGGLFSQQRVRSYAEIVNSPPVTRGVIARLGLRTTPEKLGRQISAEAPVDTVLINVTAKDGSPRQAKAIADAVGQEFARFVNVLETEAGSRTSPVKVSITQPAQLPTDPVAPRKAVYLALGVLLGLVVGIAGAVLLDALDNRVRNEEEAAVLVGAPVVGAIPEDRDADRRPLVVIDDPASLQAEAYRGLRTTLRVLSVDRDLRSVVISSAVPGEGKTLVVANVGIAFAQAGYRVLLIDANLRRPRLTAVLGLPLTVGLTDVLVDDLPVEDALQTWTDGLPLEVLGAGRRPPNPSELLGSQRFAAMLGDLTEGVDIVILDAPAVLPVTDAAILARLTSGVLLVAHVRSTKRDQLETATRSLHAVDEQVLGVVLNRARAHGARRGSGQGADRGVDVGIGATREVAGDVSLRAGDGEEG